MAAIPTKPANRRELHVLLVGGLADTDLVGALRLAGYDLWRAADPAGAAEAAKLAQPDVVILHTATAGGDGFEAAREVLRASGWRKPLIVALTDRADADAYRRSREAGVHLYAEHPADPGKVVGLLRRFRALIADVEGFDPVI